MLFDTVSKTGCRTSRISKLPNIVYSNVGLQWAKFSSVKKKYSVVLLTTSLAVSIFAQAVSLPEDLHSVKHNTLD